MLIRHNVDKSNFIERASGASMYCYGAGKMFLDFLCLYASMNVVGVIDDRVKASGENANVHGIPVISLDDFLEDFDGSQILLITCYDYYDVVERLNKVDSLDALECYIYYELEMQLDSEEACDLSCNRYQITEFKLQDCTAGQKAPADVARIAAKLGYQALTPHRGTVKSGSEQTKKEWLRICNAIPQNSFVLIQLPLVDGTDGIYQLDQLKKEKNIKIMAVVHDLDILRYDEITDYMKKQYEIINSVADVWIVHNESMIEKMIEKGFDREKLVNLQIFDYLASTDEHIQTRRGDGIIIAGNLSRDKSRYIYDLSKIQNVTFNLYGAYYEEEGEFDNINYYGSFLPDELIVNLCGRFGLVWDGNSIETCSGGTGEYLRINNPHKLSLYLAVGLPVIIWSEAAEAAFVQREGVGFTVESLAELSTVLPEISDEDYYRMRQNAERVGERLRNGEYMKRAIREAEGLLL